MMMIKKFILPLVVQMILQSYNNAIRGCCSAKYIEVNNNETRGIIFTMKDNAISN
jgi:hypothetical protein